MQNLTDIPRQSRSGRSREYNDRTHNEIAQITNSWLLAGDMSHRDMDREILGLDPAVSKGWQSMGVLHFLGLKKQFKGIFRGKTVSEAIEALSNDDQNWVEVIRLLRSQNTAADLDYAHSLEETGKDIDSNFLENLEHRLSELGHTDTANGNAQTRREQAILRTLLFKGGAQSTCALCHNELPTSLLVAAHIKPRTDCLDDERKDPNVVMPVCKIGCDDFFEKGYVTVDHAGSVRINDAKPISADLRRILTEIEGNHCSYFNAATSAYFDYKRMLVLD